MWSFIYIYTIVFLSLNQYYYPMVKNIYKNVFALPSLASSICVWTQFIKVFIFLLVALVPGKNSLFFHINSCFIRLFHFSLIFKFLSQGIIYRLLPTLLWRQIDLVVLRSKGISRPFFWIEKRQQHKDNFCQIIWKSLKLGKQKSILFQTPNHVR